VNQKTRAARVFERACSVYVLSLLIVIPFMTWKDTVCVVTVALIGYGLGRWKGKAHEAHILPLAIAYMAIKPFLHYGPYSTNWQWQRFGILASTAILAGLLLILRADRGYFLVRRFLLFESEVVRPGIQEMQLRLFPLSIALGFLGLGISTAVVLSGGWGHSTDLSSLSSALAVFCLVYPIFLSCFLTCGPHTGLKS
jgi:hypothetical protein